MKGRGGKRTILMAVAVALVAGCRGGDGESAPVSEVPNRDADSAMSEQRARTLALIEADPPEELGAELAQLDFGAVEPHPGVHVVATLRLDADLHSVGGEGGVSVAPDGTIYVSNFNMSVWAVSPRGEVRLLTDQMSAASGNEVLPSGELLQADFGTDQVVVIDRDGNLRTVSEDGLDGPVGVTRGSDGAVYVANCMEPSIARIPPGGGPAEPFATHEGFGCPNGIEFGPEGDLLVADLESPILFRVSMDGTVTELADLGGPGNGHLAVVGDHVYVTQLRAHRIVRLEPNGTVGVVAGDGTKGWVNGPEGTSTVSFPNGIAVDPTGTELYFNSHAGTMAGGHRGAMILRSVLLPD